jgi:AMP nucleosidase
MAPIIGGVGAGRKPPCPARPRPRGKCHRIDMSRVQAGATLAGPPRLRVRCRIISKKAMMTDDTALPILTPDTPPAEAFTDPAAAVRRLEELFRTGTEFLSRHFSMVVTRGRPAARVRAFYPEIRLTTTSFSKIDSRLSFGHVAGPGTYSTTITRPDLFRNYLEQMIGLLIQNHGVPVLIGPSETPIPVHFAVAGNPAVSVPQDGVLDFPIRDVFDVPDLSTTNDDIVNGTRLTNADGSFPLAPFSAQRVDYSLARLTHYTATDPEHFQNHVLFTNYQFYVDEFEAFARAALADPSQGYVAFVAPGNQMIHEADAPLAHLTKMPQMPAYHLKRADGQGISLVNIGVGPSNAKTATDHIAVLRPHAWLMVGHCAGLRNSQSLGDFVLAHAYVREDHVLDDDLPVWVPIPALAEIQIALQQAVAEVTQLEGYELKRIMRTGTVATIDNRNWELRDQSGPVARLSQSRAIALDMESATIAANGFRFRVPYGTLLCVSDKPLHGELKLPGMASEFYKTQVASHLKIGVRAMELLRQTPLDKIHSRKLRSFEETAFL